MVCGENPQPEIDLPHETKQLDINKNMPTTKTEKCLTCNGKGVIPIYWPPTFIKGDPCPACKGAKTIEVTIKETGKLKFSKATRDIPDTPGLWFYHATGCATTVVRKEDGQLYFRHPFQSDQEMALSTFVAKAGYGDDNKFSKLTTDAEDDDFDLSTP